MKKLLSLLLTALLALSLAAPACAEESVELTIFGVGATIPEDDPVIPELERRLGIKITLDNMTADAAALTTRIAGGDIPDVFRLGDVTTIKTFYDSGVLLNVRDYLNQMPNVAAAFGDDPGYWGPVTFDGGYYAIPRRAEVNYVDWWVRADWLTELGMEMPSSFDELMALALAMNNADLDGNGKADTYAISGVGLNNRTGAFNGFFTAYGVTGPNTLMIRDNQAVYACTTDEFKLAVEEIRRFVEAGVVDPEIVSNNGDGLLEKAASGKTGIVYHGWTLFGKQAYRDILTSIEADADWAHLNSISTEYGASGATKTAVNYVMTYCLSADLADEPEKLAAALKLFDYITVGEGDMLMSYGIEGLHYTVEDGKIKKLDAMSKLTYGWALQFTGREDMVYCMTKFAECSDEIEYAATQIPVLYHYADFVQQPEGINFADIKSYEVEQITQFIFGGRDMGEWDSFIETLYNVYNLSGYLESATRQLTDLGFIR